MTNEEIKALLRELAEKAEAQGETRSKTVRITFDPKEEEEAAQSGESQRETGRKKKRSFFSKGRSGAPETAEDDGGITEDGEKDGFPQGTADSETDALPDDDIRSGDAPKEKTGRFAWKMPETDEDETEETEDEEAFISVLPKTKAAEPGKRPENYREGKTDPQAEPEEDADQEPEKKKTLLIEDADFASDADAFAPDWGDTVEESRFAAAAAAVFGAAFGGLKNALGKSRKKTKAKGKDLEDLDEDSFAEEEHPDDPGETDEAETRLPDEPEEEESGVPDEPEEEGTKLTDEPEEGESGLTDEAEEDRPDDRKVHEVPDLSEETDTSEETDAAENPGKNLSEEAGENASGEADSEEENSQKVNSVEDASGEAGEAAVSGENRTEQVSSEEEEQPEPEEKAGFMEKLREKGISGKEIVMIATGAVLAGLILFMGIRMLGNRTAGRLIESDEGLTVKVVSEPQEWTSAGETVLDIRTSAPIQSVSVNGESMTFEGTNSAKVSLEAKQRELEVLVVCEDSVLSGHTELEWIDSDAPELTISQEGGMISLSAEDTLSGVEAVCYGEITGYSNVPSYRVYTQPFALQEGVVYSCFARDNAGNVSVPVVTDFGAPEEIRFSTEKISLFPGENAYLKIETEPEYAYLSGLTLTNSDGSVVALEENGLVRGLTEGSTKIQASVAGLTPAICEVEVHEEADLTISAVGDVTMGDDENFSTTTAFSTVYNANGSSYFFENVKSIFASDDITFANLEGTLTTQGTREAKEYAFRGDPSYTQILKDGSVEAVTLANNHSKDYGEISLTDTEKYLDEAGIAWCCGDKIAYVETEGVKVGLIGIYVLADGLERSGQVESTIREAKANGAQIIVAAFHWGSEASTEPDETQRTLAHLAVDSGADLVVGHHPHVLQGIEQYNGKYIAYSLANFCFGGNSNPSDKDTMIFQQSFKVSADGNVEPGEINIIPCSVSSQSGLNNYQPTPASGSEQERIMSRIREMSEALGTTLA